ncbi:MAG: SMC family ATPase [Saccharofermentans sp.]|nr:SMC family ATPase [Saccharofermentans sp.]
MRPLLLKIQAFGPFPNYVEIDFTKLGRNGLFLITGDTGAGKTTIFDAISYGLYNDVNGSDRDISMVRCKSADNNTPTYVELTFEKDGVVYVVKRSPSYEYKDSKGKIKKSGQKVELYVPDKPVNTQWSVVNNELIEIIGMDFKQYSMIAMIAQGEFRKFMMLDSKEKSAVFSKLFDTKIYEKIQSTLVEEAKNVSKDIADINKSISEKVNEIVCEDTSSLFMSVNDAKSQKLPPEEIITLIGNIVSEDEIALSDINDVSTKLDSQITEVQVKLDRLNLQNSILKSISMNSLQIENVIPQIDTVSNEITSLNEKADMFEEVKKKATIIMDKLSDYDVLEANIQSLSKINEDIIYCEKQIGGINQKIAKYSDIILSYENKLKLYDDVEVKLEKTRSEATKLTEKIDTLTSLKSDIEKYNQIYSEHRAQQANYLSISNKTNECESQLRILRTRFYDAQAGIIARDLLMDGQPCPVCGVISDHRCPAIVPDGVPSQDEVLAKEDEFNSLNSKLKDASVMSGALRGQVESLSSVLNKNIEESLGNMSIEDALIKIPEQLSDLYSIKQNLNKEEKSLIAKINEKQTIIDELPKLKQENDKFSQLVVEENNYLIKLKTEHNNVTNAIDELKTKFEYSSKLEAEKAASKLMQSYNEFIANKASSEKRLNDLLLNKKSLEAAIEEAKKNLTDEKIDFNSENEKLIALKEKKNIIKKQIDKYTTAITINTNCKTSISKKYIEVSDIYNRAMWLNELVDTASGSLKNSVKMTLVAYVQAYYLKLILAKCNLRLLKMTNGQYELIHRTEPTSKQGQVGLDLDAFDHYDNAIRDVGSLSGGEKFLASLALALGLADVIQDNNGGVKLDSMFVDEGFGSLDDETLNHAYKALSSLSQGDRMVGLISHVTEIKNRIDKQIVVKKLNGKNRSVEIVV